MRTAAILSTVVLTAGLVAGCGSSSGDSRDTESKSSAGSYCDGLKAAKADFAAMDSDTPDFEKLEDAFKTFHELAESAPSEVSAEWKTLDDGLTGIERGLADAGVSLKDLGDITAGTLPEGMTAEDLQSLAPKLAKAFGDLSGDAFDRATDKIEKHAKSDCKIDITVD